MSKKNILKLEQEFLFMIYKKKIYKLNYKQSKNYLKRILKKMMIKDNIIKYYIKRSII